MISVICSVSDVGVYDGYLGQSLKPIMGEIDFVTVFGNESIFKNYAEGASRAKCPVKVFVHQDVNLGSPDWIGKVLSTFMAYPDVGLIGMVGTTELLDKGMWWESNKVIGELYSGLEKADWTFKRLTEPTYCACVDGFFMATNRDVPWDTSMNGFHLYDMDYCREMTKRGYKIMVIPHKAWHIGAIRPGLPDFAPYNAKWGINA